MDEIKRVFFHELGHFIANEIRARYFKSNTTNSILIYPHPLFPNLFLGEHKINLSEDKREMKPPEQETLAEYLASSVYGCIFQAYFQDTSLNNCFNNNGGDDIEKMKAALILNGFDWPSTELSLIEKEYFQQIVQQKMLDNLMSLNIDNYLIENELRSYTVNINKLRADTNDFVQNHHASFEHLVKQYNEAISKF